MKSASQLSLEIRRKKKAMQDNPEVVDLSGIPMDKTDEDTMEQDELTAKLGMDKNHPKVRSAHQELMEDSEDRKHEEEAPMMAEGGEVDEASMKRKERLAKRIKC